MISAAVYSKTAMGEEELRSPARRISQAARQLLIVIDGKRSLDDLVSLFGPQTVASHLSTLESGGFVQRRAPSRNTLSGRSAERTAELSRKPGLPIIPIGIAFALGLVAAAGILTSHNKPSPPAQLAADGSAPGAGVSGTLSASTDPVPPPLPAGKDRPSALARASTTSVATPRSGSGAGTSATSAAHAAAPASGAALARPPAPMLSAGASREAASSPGEPAQPSPEPTHVPLPAASPPVSDATGSGTALAVAAPTAPVIALVTAAHAPEPPPSSASGTSATAAPSVISTPAASPPAAPASTDAATATARPTALHARNRELPEMPRLARRAGVVEGRLVVQLVVNAAGTVDSVQVDSAQPPSIYDDNVRATLARWTFDPPGHTVHTRIAISFRP